MARVENQRKTTMNYQGVLLSLTEAFPQVDVRVLRATAMEHRQDINGAANFILTEVLPHLKSSKDDEIHADVQPETPSSKEPSVPETVIPNSVDPPPQSVDYSLFTFDASSNASSQKHEPSRSDISDAFSALQQDKASQNFLEELTIQGSSLCNDLPAPVDEDEHHSCCETTGSSSSQILNVHLLEDFLNDAKNGKQMLTSVMESVVSLFKEAEIHEEAAILAKEESSNVGLDIITKTEDLKKMLIHARERNDMHAGELYGEKSILATEARELQSRLLGIADERDRMLSIIEQMRMSLEARITAAQAESIAAKEEKLRKEEEVLKLFEEQEKKMDIVAQESQKLQQQSEENSKLREFLMDRGRTIDTLQGEISVICEDVFLLKKSIDENIPFDKFLRSKPTSLTSSMTSRRSTMSDSVPELIEFSDNSKVVEEHLRKVDHEANPKTEASVSASDETIISPYVGWQFFEDAEVLEK